MSRRGSWRALVAGAVAIGWVGTGCGNADDAEGGVTTTSIDVVESVSVTSPANRPVLGELFVTDGCAEVRLVGGVVWSESCLEPDIEVVAVTSQTIDGVELALLRFAVGVELVGADPASVTFEQSDGWALVESPTPDFTMTFRQDGVDAKAVCTYNPFFVDCDVAAAG